jgi:hypothetical protein
MSLPRRQQRDLDQIERALHAADPGLRSLFASFTSLTSPNTTAAWRAGPAVESLSVRPSIRTLVVCVMVLVCLLGALIVGGVHTTGDDCQALSADAAVASAAARYPSCGPSGNVWSRGGR